MLLSLLLNLNMFDPYEGSEGVPLPEPIRNYRFTICDEHRRVIQAVLIDTQENPFQNGVVYNNTINDFVNGLGSDDLIYKVETDEGVLVGFFVYNTITNITQQAYRRPFAAETAMLQREINNFIASGLWVFDTLSGDGFYSEEYSFSEYNPDDYIVQQYSYVWMDEVERVAQAVLIASGGVTAFANGNVVRTNIDTVLQQIADYHIAYKIENQQGILVGFFVYKIDDAETMSFIRKPFQQFNAAIETSINAFVASGNWQFDFLNRPAYIERVAYNVTDYNPNDYVVQMYSFVQLEYTERVVQAVLIDGKTQFLTLNANGNVIRAELDNFMETLSDYRVTYKIENQQGVLVGFFASDPCVDGYIVAVRRPYNQYLSAVNQAVENFVTSGVWRFDLLNIEPCPPSDIPCYFTLNDCYMMVNGCVATIDPKKKFVKRYF